MDQQPSIHLLELRGILKEEYQLAVPEQCNDFLTRCIRLKDGNVQKAAKLVQAYHAAIPDLLAWNAILKPSAYINNFYKIPVILPLKIRDMSGSGVIIARANQWDPQKVSFDEAVMAVWILVQFGIQYDVEIQRNGVTVIWDFKDLSPSQAIAVKQKKLRKMVKWSQNGVMGKIKGFHVINHPKVVGVIYAVIRPFLSEKMRSRTHFHSSLHKLHESIQLNDAKMLPKFLGGDMDENDCVDTNLLEELSRSDEFFQNWINHGFPTR